MKSLKQHITEKLVLNSNSKIRKQDHKYHPTTKEELVEIIKSEVEKNGWECDLNHIDVSEITDMSHLFSEAYKAYGLAKFNGDISRWNVSNVKNMNSMFWGAKFNNDISKWDVSNVTDMEEMFEYAYSFNQDLSNWKLKTDCETTCIFYCCPIEEEYKPKFKK